jgi:hypothetical protein
MGTASRASSSSIRKSGMADPNLRVAIHATSDGVARLRAKSVGGMGVV